MGIQVKHITKNTRSKRNSSETSIWKREINIFGSRFNSKKKEQFFTELSVLLRSGIRLKDALELIAQAQKKEQDRIYYEGMQDQLNKGLDFSSILREDANFTTYDEKSVYIGGHTGTLEKVTASLGKFYAKKNELRRTILGALTYPAIVTVTAVLAVLFMLRFVVPMFQDVFRQNNIELPGLTKSVIAVSTFLGTYGYWIIITFLAIVILCKIYSTSNRFKNIRDSFLQKIPFLGPFLNLIHIARFSQALSLLTEARVNIPDSIRLTKDMVTFVPLKKALVVIESDLLKGKSLSECLQMHSIFDNRMVTLVKVAEETNQTIFVFSRLEAQYESTLSQRSKQFSTILEPMMILIVGMLVATILIAMYLPMFELGNVL